MVASKWTRERRLSRGASACDDEDGDIRSRATGARGEASDGGGDVFGDGNASGDDGGGNDGGDACGGDAGEGG